MSYQVVTRVISESGTASGRLGRHVEHDSRSRSYAVTAKASKLVSVRHSRLIPVLDQGDLGSCTGNAATGSLGTDPNYVGTVKSVVTNDAARDEQVAVRLYSAATQLDSVSGNYPPNDTGSTGLAVAKAAQKAGYIVGYQHAFALTSVLAALQTAPVIIGINWYEGFDQTGSDGLARVSGQVLGGHEVVVDEINVDARTVTATNSWTTSWGRQGRFEFSWADFERLLGEDGDAVVFAPLSAPVPVPAPTPVPVPPTPVQPPTPTPDDVDKALWTAAKQWAKERGLL